MNIDRRKLKITAVIVCIALLAGVVLNQTGLLHIATADEVTTWNGVMPESADANYKFSGGSGTSSSPYKIATAQDFAYLSVNTNAGIYEKKTYFRLENNLNLANKEWKPIGKSQTPFTGSFDGNGMTIEGLYLNVQGDCGLFGYTSKADTANAEIYNLKVSGMVTNGGSNAGGIIGSCNNTNVKNCTFNGQVVGSSCVGGIAGLVGSSSVINGCNSLGNIQSSNYYVGGIAGKAVRSTVINCCNRASVMLGASTGDDESVAGGLVGFVDNANLVNSYNTGSVQSNYYGGGIAGGNHATILNCYNIGRVTGSGTLGDISGKMDSTSILNSVFYIASVTDPVKGTVPSANNITNVGKISLVNEPLTRSNICIESEWTLGEETTLYYALKNCVTASINTYQNICEWAKDTQTTNQGFPILTTIVGHIHDKLGVSKIDRDATCEKPGQISTKCSKCDYETVDPIPVKPHDWQEQVLVEPTCTTTGESVEVCSMCEKTQNKKDINALGHEWKDYTLSATCTKDGYYVKKCEVCKAEDESTRVVYTAPGHTYVHSTEPAECEKNRVEIDTCVSGDSVVIKEITGTALGHNWDYVSGQYVSATCVNEGGYVRTCLRGDCGRQEIVSGYEPKAAHKYAFLKKVEPTCLESGYTVNRCSVCQKEEYDEKIDYVIPLGHDYEEEVVEPTCKERGYTHHTCIRCKDTYDDAFVETLAHQWLPDEENSKPASCMTSGKEVEKCELCGEKKTKTIASFGGHDYVTAAALEEAPTCTKAGAKYEQCTRCEKSRKSEVIKALGHDYKPETIPAKCLEDGSVIQKCSRCDDFYKESSIPATGHDFKTSLIPPTTTSMGYTLTKCSYCDESEETDFIAATPDARLNLKDLTLRLSDVEEVMRYSLDGGVTWITAGAVETETVTQQLKKGSRSVIKEVTAEAVSSEGLVVQLDEESLDPKKGIQVVRPGNSIKPLRDSEVQYITFTKGEQPPMVNTVQPTIDTETGSVSGVDDSMEYRHENDKTWTPVTGTTIDNLAPGTYYIRRKATDTSLASDPIMFIIKAKNDPEQSQPPVESDVPQVSGQPGASMEPGQSQTPGTSAKPGQSQTPGVSAKPGQSQISGNNTSNSDNGKSQNSTDNGTVSSSDARKDNTDNKKSGSASDDKVIMTDVHYNSNGGTSSGSNKVKSARTGDESSVVVWMVLAGAAVTMFAALTVKKRREIEE